MIEAALITSIVALGIGVYAIYENIWLRKRVDQYRKEQVKDKKLLNETTNSLLELRRDFNAKVIETLKEWSGYDEPFSVVQKSEREVFELRNQLPAKSRFFDEDEGFDVVKTASGFRFKKDGESRDIDTDAFYDLWFSGEITKVE